MYHAWWAGTCTLILLGPTNAGEYQQLRRTQGALGLDGDWATPRARHLQGGMRTAIGLLSAPKRALWIDPNAA